MEIIPVILMFIILLFFIIFCFRKAISLMKAQKRVNPKVKTVLGMYNHVLGLNLVENAKCKLFIHDDKIVIESSGVKFNLLKDKILDVSIKTETEIQKQYVSSAGGAIAGNALLGPVGAMIGGRIKEKTSKTSTSYLIYTYEKDNNIDYIVFDILDGINAHKFISDFLNSNKKLNKEVTL